MIKQSKENTVHILNGLKENTSFLFFKVSAADITGPRSSGKL